ncbi:MAG: error-prone DNA polymerase [Phycisphaerae bacterium]
MRTTELRRDRVERFMRYVELHCRSNFSFLRGASHPDELCARAAELGYAALGITDCNTLAGVVRMHVAAKEHNLRLLVGAEIVPDDAPPVLLFPTDRAAYGRLCRLITRGRLRMPRGGCRITFDDIAGFADGQIAVVLPDGGRAPCESAPLSPPHRGEEERTPLTHYRELFGDRLYLAAEFHRSGDARRRMERLVALSREHRVPLVAANDVHYHIPERRCLQDVLTCIREHCTLASAGARLHENAERHLRPLDEIERLYAAVPGAVERTAEIADRCRFSLDELRYEYPEEPCPPGRTPVAFLRELTWAGAKERFGDGVPTRVRNTIEHELRLIEDLGYARYFLTVWDLVRFARSRGILCQGRGSAANSVVCYCLGITAVDPDRADMLFERFVSRERNEPPDIDVDFEHERREEVFQYIYDKYGRERAGITAEVITYRPRSAVRDVGKALGLSLDRVDALAGRLEWWSREKLPEDRLREAGLDPADRTVRALVALVGRIIGFPRHLSQHVGGFVITKGALCELVPIENGGMPGRTFIEWDKDDIDALGILKVDCLALGMLTCIRKCFELIHSSDEATERGSDEGGRSGSGAWGPGRQSDPSNPGTRNPKRGLPPLALHTIPAEDPRVYDMLCRADSVGVFQVESRAQMSMLPRLRPRCFYDLVIEVAIVRPGPIQGGMVHPYLRRRSGREPITYPSPAIQEVLGKTLGVPLFQEQAMRLSMVAAGFSPGEADQLRRAMGAWRRPGVIEKFRERLIRGMTANGLPRRFAEQMFEQICGFGEYGFPESHAASFALLVYASAWLKLYYPAAYAAALLNSQPMGFYAPAQIVQDAQRHGVEVRGIDVNVSEYDCTLEKESDEATERRSDEGNVLQPHAGSLEYDRVFRAAQVIDSRGGGSNPSGFDPEPRKETGERRSDVALRRAGGPAPSSPSSLRRSVAPSLRLGFRLIKGISPESVRGIEAARREGPFRGVADVARRARVGRGTLARLAAADAFRSLGLDRRQALWDVLALREELPLLAALDDREAPAPLPGMPIGEQVVADYDATGLSLAAHPISLVRELLNRLRVVPAARVQQGRHSTPVRIAGLVLVRQRPGTAGGIVFATLEDETGIVNLILRPAVYERFRAAAHGFAWLAEGRIERSNDVVHVQATRIEDLSDRLAGLRVSSRDFH